MRPMGLNRKYIVGILDDRQTIFNQDYANAFKELTEFFTRFKYFGKVLHGKSVNEILDKAIKEENIEYCVIQSVGHFIKEISFFQLIERWIEERDFFITGHIIDKETVNMQSKGDGYYGLHKQCLLVNLNYYKKLNKPDYGNKNEKDVTVAKAKRHSKDIHDDYTPLGLFPTEETQVCTPIVDGWNFISKSLEYGLTVYNFHPKIRDSKSYAYPNKSLKELQSQLSWINQILAHAPNCVFFWNTENYRDLQRNSDLIKEPVQKLYSVAASFKPNFILNTYGFTDSTEVVYYDYSKQALAFKNLLLQQWNGSDYPQFLYDIKSKININETTHNPYGQDNYEELWEVECERWGGADNIKEHWDRYKKLKHTYVHCNIVENAEKFYRKIDNTPNSVIWWSNCFHTVNTHYTRRLSEVEDLYKSWLNNIAEKNPTMWVFGKDYLNRPVEGNQVKNILLQGDN